MEIIVRTNKIRLSNYAEDENQKKFNFFYRRNQNQNAMGFDLIHEGR